MTKLEMDVETALPMDRVRAALLDFSERRPDIWPGIDRSLYEVYATGDTWADIREGTKFPGTTVWAKEHYDWSTPDLVTWTVQESNFSSVGSYVSAALSPREGGGTRIHITWDREPTSPFGRFAMWMIRATKGKPISRSIQKGLERVAQQPSP